VVQTIRAILETEFCWRSGAAWVVLTVSAVRSRFATASPSASCDSWPDSFLTEVFQLVMQWNLAFFHILKSSDTPVSNDSKCFTALPGGVAQLLC
jgi:hypothetical protein